MFFTILTVLLLILFFIITLPVYLILLLISCFNKKAASRAAQFIVKYAFRLVLLSSATRYKVIGLENVPKDTPVLYAANHRSFFDAALGYATAPTLTAFIAKDGVEKVPFLSWWMKLLCCLFLNRTDPREGLKTILRGVELVKDGYSIYVMPEGTRNHEPEMLPFKDGCFKIAEKTSCPVIPVGITGSDKIFELQFPKIKPAKVIIQYGKPILLSDLDTSDKRALSNTVRSNIEALLKDNEKYSI